MSGNLSVANNIPSPAVAFSCPVHTLALVPRGDFLACPAGDSFPLVNGIPRFVDGAKYANAFGAQWKRYRLTQLDSHSGAHISRDRARRALGETLWQTLRDHTVLECGCGAGRFTEILLERGALVTSIDLSDAVDANQQNFPQSKRHQIAQADILRLPFRPGQFDIVFVLGVIQHTPNPEATIAALSQHVKPGGVLVIDHYTYQLSEFTKTALLLRPVLKRLDPARGLRWTEWAVNILLPLHKRVRNHRWAQALLSRISPVASYYHAYPQLSDEMQYQWALVDTHDALTCWYRRFRTGPQIELTLRELGFEEISCEYGGNGVQARGKRPLIQGSL